jgi:tRNA uridine 5-carboxymethylaminomethyl modification enzyme
MLTSVMTESDRESFEQRRHEMLTSVMTESDRESSIPSPKTITL